MHIDICVLIVTVCPSTAELEFDDSLFTSVREALFNEPPQQNVLAGQQHPSARPKREIRRRRLSEELTR